ncbi:ATP-binding protein [Agrococcus versicolor]|uniref:ATP-binding protein n=1 Tax=Agrococcus versicolor TaxID=501482 RepID=A0ABP5MM09_9MICO
MSRKQEQSIAVFGESGSGKTVLLSSFYGAAQEPGYAKDNLFHLIADEAGQGARLHRNYLGMRDSARVPMPNRFAATSYGFSLKFRTDGNARVARARPFDAMRLVWHDYPGEWFDGRPDSDIEAERRVDTFRSLLGADVALILIDGQKLLDNAGEEERYLRHVMSNFKNTLIGLRDDLLDGGKPLVEFPRIWIFALSKSDLLPDLDVFAFRDLLIEKAGPDIDELRDVLGTLVEGKEALSVGEDFTLLSSAKFGEERIELGKRVGVDLILPIAAMLPVQRHLRWADGQHLPRKVAEQLVADVKPLVGVVLGGAALLAQRLPPPFGPAVAFAIGLLSKETVDEALRLVGDRLKEANATALAKHDYLRAALTRFGMDLEKGEADRKLLRSQR